MESVLPSIEGLKLREARGFWARLRGLIGAPPPLPGEGLLFKRCSAIHTCFMSYPIDAIFLDCEGRVVRVEKGVRPWRLCVRGGAGAAMVVETASATDAGAPVDVSTRPENMV